MLARRVNIGQMDRLITIQRPVTLKNIYGEDVPTWQTFKTVYSKVEDSAGGERIMADQLTATRTSTMTIRNVAVDVTMRVLLDGVCYNISSIQKPDRNGYLILKCEIKDDQG